MKIREFGGLALTAMAGVVSAIVTLSGVYSIYGLDFRQDTVLSVLYCLLPILCFPVFILVRPAIRSAVSDLRFGGRLSRGVLDAELENLRGDWLLRERCLHSAGDVDDSNGFVLSLKSRSSALPL